MEDQMDMDMADMKRDQLLLNLPVTMLLEDMAMEDQVVMDMVVITMKRDQLLLNLPVTMLLEDMAMEDQVDMAMEVLIMKKDLLQLSLVMGLLMSMLSKRIMVMDTQSHMSMVIIFTKDLLRPNLDMATVTHTALPMFTSLKPTMDMAIQNPIAMATIS